MRCTSASISSASASAMVVLPRPDSPTKISAAFFGFAANPERIRFGLSRPIKSAIRRGRYFSARGCGNPRENCGAGNRLIGGVPFAWRYRHPRRGGATLGVGQGVRLGDREEKSFAYHLVKETLGHHMVRGRDVVLVVVTPNVARGEQLYAACFAVVSAANFPGFGLTLWTPIATPTASAPVSSASHVSHLPHLSLFADRCERREK